ncbi:type VII secretion-associated serine protease mycosin [Mycolicibacterium rhodesiae]|uniref:Type VII secretion-associated serine protease mycosin n=1 Tax=Mycolicibacterium rhodesiae TaxID=36814 RepID=A0A1X0INA7_MYCRH|nr:type VII secretion-associated serine protease mycosin [Mycolicibacterium rhodesiae]MCV7347303.1 type VII secretion-associated serine protease mycosin [Mycolicibacterium rhodesiae]ORB49551.1 type VII secretion-associated serine protease mycosin [Mycolicibacterium rhodesiae]
MLIHCAPPTFAVVPPPIDNSLLPSPAPPAPPRPTEQRRPCTVPLQAGAGSSASHLAGFDATAVWRLTRGAGQRVAVIDTGIAAHRRLPDVVAGGDYVSTGDGRQDCDGHGTVVAGIIAAAPDQTDRTGFTGIAPEATLIGIRQSSNKFGPVADPGDLGFGDVSTLAMAVRTAADMGASVINISSVACAESSLDDRALGAALSYAVDVKDSVVVVAAGNVGGDGQCPAQNTTAQPSVIASPAWYDDYVLTVGSVGPDGAPSEFSLNGPWVDVAAPGENIVSLDPDGDGVINALPTPAGQASMSGTSYAAPIVAGVVALVRSRFPRLSARQVMTRIEATAHHPAPGWNAAVGNGVIDPLAALSDHTNTPPAHQAVRAAVPLPTRPADNHRYAVAGSAAALCVAGIVAASVRLRRRTEDVAAD